MNANMKRLLIFALVPVTVWGIGSTFTKQKIDRIGVNTESQITMEDTTRFSSGTASTVPYLDASKDLVSSSITPTELGYLSGVSSSIQTQINGKQDPVGGTANEIDFASNIIGLADNPILPGLEGVTIPSGATGDRPVSPNTGQFRWNTDNAEAEIYDGSQWGAVGGGAGGSRLNLLDDPSFEKGVANGSCTGCTATQDTTDYLATPNNEASLKMAFSAASGNYTWTESTSAQYSNVAGTVSAWIKTSASDCHFDELVNGTQSQTVAIASSDEWKQYIINGTTGTTSYGWRVRCDTAITDNVFVDETFAGAATPDTFDIGTASLWGSVKWDATTNCVWTTTGTSFSNYGQDLDCDDNARTVRGQYNSTSGVAANSDGSYPQIKFSYIPAGVLRCEAKGFYYSGAPAEYSMRFNDGTNSTSSNTTYTAGASGDLAVANYVAGEFNYKTNQGATTINLQAALTTSTGYIQNNGNTQEFEISCYHYPSPQKVVAASCSGLECEQVFSAVIDGSGNVSSENVDFVNGNCTYATGTLTCNYNSGVFNSTPSCTVTTTAGDSDASIRSQSTSSIGIWTGIAGVSSTQYALNLVCQRQGSDYKQFDQRFVPVSEKGYQTYSIQQAGSSLTNASAEIEYALGSATITNTGNTGLITASDDSGNTRTKFTANEPVSVSITFSATTNTAADKAQVWKNGTAVMKGNESGTTPRAVDVTAHVELDTGDYFTVGNETAVYSSAAITYMHFKAAPRNLTAFIGNLTPKEFVQTPSASKPVIYSAKIGATGTVSNEIGDWINGNCTNASPMVCTFNSGTWSSTPPNCTISDVSTANAQFCEFNGDPGTSTMSIKCYNYLASDQTTAIEKNVICHGVQ